jgi:hypothetical protein
MESGFNLEGNTMDAITKNWKTTLTAAVIVGIAALKTFLGLNIPGALDIATAIPVAVGLVFAKDATA